MRLLLGEPRRLFDGVDFSSVIHVKNSDDKTESVKFFFPIRMMRCFVSYDCTGQQLINAGTCVMQNCLTIRVHPKQVCRKCAVRFGPM